MHTPDTGERVSILEIQSAAPNLIEAFRQWQVIGEGTRGDKSLYHAYISPAEQYANIMTPEQWLRAADVLAKELGLENQPRAIVLHDGHGRPHAHIVWQRTDVETMRMIEDGNNYAAHERASAALEMEFGHEHVPGKHSKRDRAKQPEPPKETFTTAEQQQAARTELTPTERKAQITALRAEADNGQAFKNALEEAGYILAKGERRALVIVDGEGEVFSLSRHVTDLKAKDLKSFMAGIDPELLPSAEEAKGLQQEHAKQAALARAEKQREEKARSEAPQPAPAPPPLETPVKTPATDRGVEVSKFLKAPAPAPLPEATPEVSKFLKDPATAALEKAIADRQAVELQKWHAFHAKELAQTEYVFDRDVAEKMKNHDAVQLAAVTRLEREHKRQESDVWERIQRKVNPAGAAQKAQARRVEAEALQRRMTQERKDYLALQIQSKELDLNALRERHDQKIRDVTGGFGAEKERYLKDQERAQRLLAEVQDQRRQEEERLKRDGPEPPRRVR